MLIVLLHNAHIHGIVSRVWTPGLFAWMCNRHNHPLNGYERDDMRRDAIELSSGLLHTYTHSEQRTTIEHREKKLHELCHTTKWVASMEYSPLSLSPYLLPTFFGTSALFPMILLPLLSTNCCFLPAYHHSNCNRMFFFAKRSISRRCYTSTHIGLSEYWSQIQQPHFFTTNKRWFLRVFTPIK